MWEKTKQRFMSQKETGVTFKDVAGQDEAKESLQEVVDFLENPGKYTTSESQASQRSTSCRASGNR